MFSKFLKRNATKEFIVILNRLCVVDYSYLIKKPTIITLQFLRRKSSSLQDNKPASAIKKVKKLDSDDETPVSQKK
jgi:hypothetical protein